MATVDPHLKKNVNEKIYSISYLLLRYRGGRTVNRVSARACILERELFSPEKVHFSKEGDSSPPGG